MIKPVKVVLLGVCAVLVLLLAGITVLFATVDPNDYKPEIAEIVKDNLGRELVFKGDISFSIYPMLGFKIGSISLGNADNFEPDAMLAVNKAEVSVKLIPLFSGKIEIGMVLLDGLTLNLEKNSAGTANWDDLAGEKESSTSEEVADTKGKSGKSFDLKSFSLEGVKITNADILYDDAQSGQKLALENVNITLGRINGLASRFPFQIDLKLSLKQLPKEIHPYVSGVVDFNRSEGKVDVEDLKFSVLNINGTGSLSAAFKNEKSFGGDIHLAEMSLRKLMKNVGFELPDGSSSHILDSFSTDITFSGSENMVTLRTAKVRLGNSTLTSKALFDNGNGTKMFKGELNLSDISLRNILQEIGIELPKSSDSKTLQSFGMSFSFAGDENSARINNAIIKIDDTTLKMIGSVTDFKHPAIRVNADVDSINLDRYLPARNSSADTQEKQSSQKSEKDSVASEADLSFLKSFDLDGHLNLGKLEVMKLPVTAVKLGVSNKDGLVTVTPFSLKTCEGKYSGKAVLDATGERPVWNAEGNVDSVNIRPLLLTLAGSDLLSGLFSAEYDLSGAGLSTESIKKSVSGTASFKLSKGVVYGFDVVKMIQDGWNEIQGTSVDEDSDGNFEFTEIEGSAKILNGHAVNKDLYVKSPILEVEGEGWADLAQNNMDYTATAYVTGIPDGDVKDIFEALNGIPLPINVKGSLSAPEVGLDTRTLGKALLAGAAQQGLNILGKEIEKSLGGSDDNADEDDDGNSEKGLENLLDGLF
ncbi:AsmA family protein [Maridesulfovibrio bastinii]|uniref:AsmA family protein n=1 Tax=Maridesulfovibrio bastinii TaxID=47157 RepID=UPI00041CB719|nr:AsmA family protein [Maridesulfovibrio bastinii]